MAIASETLRTAVERSITGWPIPVKPFRYENVEYGQPLIEETWNPGLPDVKVFDRNNNKALFEERNLGRQVFELYLFPSKLASCPDFVDLANQPILHEGSKSIYHWEMERGDDVFLGSELKAWDWTSDLHWHKGEAQPSNTYESALLKLPPVVEIYEIVSGSAKIHFQEGDEGLWVPKTFSVRPGVRHRMEAGENGAIFNLRMKNARLYPQEQRHVHF